MSKIKWSHEAFDARVQDAMNPQPAPEVSGKDALDRLLKVKEAEVVQPPVVVEKAR